MRSLRVASIRDLVAKPVQQLECDAGGFAGIRVNQSPEVASGDAVAGLEGPNVALRYAEDLGDCSDAERVYDIGERAHETIAT